MIPVEEARRRILAALRPVPAETVGLGEALGRVLAEDVVARATQPPVAVSAMDGYAVRSADVAGAPVVLRRVGQAPAGIPFPGTVGPGEAVRIFTGGPVPAGADAVVLQEDTRAEGDRVTVLTAAAPGQFIRPAGLDFAVGTVGLAAGRCLTARDIGLAAAMDVPWLRVRRRPRVAVLATGDEIVMPGEPRTPTQIVSSNALALVSLVRACGGEAINLGIARDTPESLATLAANARCADLLVTTGGASEGEHDLVRRVLCEQGLELDFWKIAMRPGKPLMFGRMGGTAVLGLPGNPVSSLVCAVLFLRPALRALLGQPVDDDPALSARLAAPVPANDHRQDYLRATLTRDAHGALVATPFTRQDSAMMSVLAHADCLIVRPPHAPAAEAGTSVPILPLGGGALSV